MRIVNIFAAQVTKMFICSGLLHEFECNEMINSSIQINHIHFRIPIDEQTRKKWEEIISKHRHSNGNLICSEHFNFNDLVIRKDKYILRPGSVPSIFESTNVQIVSEIIADSHADPDNDDVANTDTTTVQSNFLICEQCQMVRDDLSAANDRFTELEIVNRINENKVRQLSEELETIRNQLKHSGLARFALNTDYIDAKVISFGDFHLQSLCLLKETVFGYLTIRINDSLSSVPLIAPFMMIKYCLI